MDQSRGREQEAAKEVARIESLAQRRDMLHAASWGFAVLGVQARDVAAVQRGYRELMRKLHPDKVQHTAAVSRALETLKEAKEACERCLSRQQVPGTPKRLAFTPLCTVPGRRRYRLHWQAPESRESAPVRRYIVAALDPAYGKALTIATLEPDYSEELRRFVSVDELGAYVLAEEELQKMPSFWRQSAATLQIAAANEAGQSNWAIVQVSLTTSRVGSHLPSSGWPPSPGYTNDGAREEGRGFEEEVRKRNPDELRSWLDRQRKPQLVEFLKSKAWPDTGTKDALVNRIILLVERQRYR